MFWLKNKPAATQRLATLVSASVLAVGLLLLMSSCGGGAVAHNEKLFNVDSLIRAQAGYLASQKAGLKKKSSLSGEAEQTTVTPADSSAWLAELEVFKDLELMNAPRNRTKYVIENSADPRSNLQVKSYTSNDDEPVVPFLKIYYHGSPVNIRRIEARYNNANALYESSRFLRMDFQDVYNKTALTSYSISGGQKILLGDTVTYTISSAVTLPN